MTTLAPTLEAFFTDRLIRQRHASPNTVAAYRDTFRLLLGYIADTTGKRPARLDFTDVDAATIGGFLQHLETQRGNCVRPATPASAPSTRSSSSQRSTIPNMPSASNRCSPSPTNDSTPRW